RRDASHQRQFLISPVANLFLYRFRQLQNLNRPALVVAAPDESLFLQCRDVLVNGGQRRQLQTLANLLKTWGIPVLVVKRNQVIQDFFLAFRQGHGAPPGVQVFHRHFRRKESERQVSSWFRVTFTSLWPRSSK